MNVDPFTNTIIQQQGIWVKTDCLAKEQATVEQIERVINHNGYQRDETNPRLWRRGSHKVILCLVDDLISASGNYDTDVPYLFDKDTLVITDNYLSCPTQYQIMSVPVSFFSIYQHEVLNDWEPERDYSFSVNRLDDRRFRLMLELALRSHLASGYVNFNCQTDYPSEFWQPDHHSLRSNFESRFTTMSQDDRAKYRPSYDLLISNMPYRNYDIAHEDIHYRSRCNIVVESYGSDTTVALSEKIFRALVLPVPWTVYGGHYVVAWLENLGFDCMSDMFNHNHYDRLKEIEDKARIFVWFSLKAVKESAVLDQNLLRYRCRQASEHNQRLLRSYQSRWPSEFAHWLDDLNRKLANR